MTFGKFYGDTNGFGATSMSVAVCVEGDLWHSLEPGGGGPRDYWFTFMDIFAYGPNRLSSVVDPEAW